MAKPQRPLPSAMSQQQHAWRPLVVATLAGMASLGLFTAIYVQHVNGMGVAMDKYMLPPPSPAAASGSDKTDPSATAGVVATGYPGAPKPLTTRFTGNPVLDGILMYLVGYFSALLDGDVAPEHRVYGAWAMMQFGGCCAVMLLEGMRRGNGGGRVVGFTSTFTTLVQVLSYMFIQPIWAIVHLLTSDVAGRAGRPVTVATLCVEDDKLWDLVVFPITVTLTYICTLVPMFLPSPGVLNAGLHYGWIAAWQPFPVYHFVVQYFLSRVARAAFGPFKPRDSTTGRPLSASGAYLACIRWVYNFITAIGVAVQLPVLALVLLPGSARLAIRDILPASLTAHLGGSSGIQSLSLWSIFAPYAPWNFPTADAENLKSGGLAPLAVHFLHYDMYIGCGSLLIWALYLYKTTTTTGPAGAGKRAPTAMTPSLSAVAARAAAWFCVGGFPAAITTVLWHRDVAVHSLTGADGRGGVKEKL
ncbi:hypothetical protein MN608_05483 [Microdochium nivale]|nr:hypothetical protein MN608_05483 [Microdochium nivale]